MESNMRAFGPPQIREKNSGDYAVREDTSELLLHTEKFDEVIQDTVNRRKFLGTQRVIYDHLREF